MESSPKIDNIENSELASDKSITSDLAVILCTKNSSSTIENMLINIKKSKFNPDIWLLMVFLQMIQ